MIFRLVSGSETPSSASEEGVRGVHDDEVDAGGGDVVALDLLRLPLAQQPVVDEDAGELVADRALHERRGDRGVDAAGQPADHAGVADLGADPGDLVRDDVAGVPVGRDAGGVVQEALDDLLAVGGVPHLGVPLHAVHPPLVARERGDRGRLAGREDPEARGRLGDRVAVAHPDDLVGGLARDERSAVGARVAREMHGGGAVLAPAGLRDRAAELLRHDLEPVADAEHGHPELEDARVERRGALLVHAGRAAGQDDARGLPRRDLGRR